jgi:hypothetical protein
MLNGWLKRLLPAFIVLTLGGQQAALRDRPGMNTGGMEADCTFMDALKNTMKIRKAHLVRPDLIPYPVDRSNYC